MIDAEHLEGFNIVNLYAHGTSANVGCYFGNNTSGIRLTNGKISGCKQQALYLLGTKGVSLTNIDVYNNSIGSSGTYDGIYVGPGTDGFQMVNGSAGKAAHFSYTEEQRYGINFAAGHVRSQLVGVRLNGNATGTYTGTPNTTAALITS